MQFRDATKEDLPAVIELLADDPLGQTRETDSTPIHDAYCCAFDEMTVQVGNRLIVVSDTPGTINGCLQLTIIPGIARMGMKRAQIEGVRVASRHRGSGLGKLLVEYAVAEAKKAGCGLVQLTTDNSRADAHRFYERLGFVASHVGMKLQFLDA